MMVRTFANERACQQARCEQGAKSQMSTFDWTRSLV